MNVPTSHIVAPADPGDSSLAQTISGMNAGSCYPGIGIATAVVNPKASDWSRVQRAPQLTQPIGWGGDSVVTGQETADLPPLLVADYVGADFNDPAIFEIATAGATAKGDVYNVTSGAALASDVAGPAVEIGDWIWGRVPTV